MYFLCIINLQSQSCAYHSLVKMFISYNKAVAHTYNNLLDVARLGKQVLIFLVLNGKFHPAGS